LSALANSANNFTSMNSVLNLITYPLLLRAMVLSDCALPTIAAVKLLIALARMLDNGQSAGTQAL